MKLAALIRVVARAAALGVFLAAAIVSQIVGLALWKPRRAPAARARWLQRTAEGCRRILALEVRCDGAFPRRGLLVANHLSYLDIIVLAAQSPCAFVAKSEVRAWPVFGWCARLGGTIFVNRGKRGDVARTSDGMGEALRAGLLLVLFPEGTSSGGAGVLPFKSSLLEPAVHLRCPVSAAALAYGLEQGSESDEICYWREMTLLPHLLNVMAKPVIHAALRLGIARPHLGDRKSLARDLHAEVAALHEVARSAAEIRQFVTRRQPACHLRRPTFLESAHSMPKYRQARCHRCGCNRQFRKRELDHLVHLGATVFTFGLWSVGWAALVIRHLRKPWRCAFCGSRWQKTEAGRPAEAASASPGVSVPLA